MINRKKNQPLRIIEATTDNEGRIVEQFLKEHKIKYAFSSSLFPRYHKCTYAFRCSSRIYHKIKFELYNLNFPADE